MAQTPVTTTGREMFGGNGYVAAGLPGSGFWVNIGLVMRVAWKPTVYKSGLKNEIGQSMRDSLSMATKTPEITITMRRHSAEIIAAMIPQITRQYAASDKNDAYAWLPDPVTVSPIGFQIRPATAYGTSILNHPDVWYIPSAQFSDIGEFILKVEDSDENNEDYELSFMGNRLLEDHTPGTAQEIAAGGQVLFQGDSSHFVDNPWEVHSPFGFVEGAPGFPEITSISGIGDNAATVNFTPPDSDAGAEFVTGYTLQYRVRDSGSAFTDVTVSDSATTHEITGLTASTSYEVRMFANAAVLNGAMSISKFLTTAAS